MANWEKIIPLLIGLGGLLLSALTLTLAHFERKRERTSSYRSALYQRQIDAVVKLFETYQAASFAMAGLQTAIQKQDWEASKHFAAGFAKQHDIMFEALGPAMPLLPNEILNPTVAMVQGWEKLIDAAKSRNYETAVKALVEVGNSEAKMIIETRRTLGIDALSTETSSLFENRSAIDYQAVLKRYEEVAIKSGILP